INGLLKMSHAIPDSIGRKYSKSLLLIQKSLPRFTKWKPRGANLMSLVMISRKINIYFAIARQRAPREGEAYVTIRKHWFPGRNISPNIAPSEWLPRWESI